jgi:hypothetical protein
MAATSTVPQAWWPVLFHWRGCAAPGRLNRQSPCAAACIQHGGTLWQWQRIHHRISELARPSAHAAFISSTIGRGVAGHGAYSS